MTECPNCKSQNIEAVEYRGTSQDYDGTSEYRCLLCGQRTGRWTGRALGEGELEPVYGGYESASMARRVAFMMKRRA